jgi:dTDP-4-amino-4,6-dideoxygalactose transaminase
MVNEYGSSFELQQAIGNNNKLEDTNNLIFLRSAREALYHICNIANVNTVLMPSLCCVSMVQPFIQAGMKVVYFKINDDLTIDLNDLKKKIMNNALILVMHYFGKRSYSENDLVFIKDEYVNVSIIQDCTQHVFTKSLYDSVADFNIGSIRKWCSIADGAFLYSKHIIMQDNIITDDRNSFVVDTYKAMKLKQIYLSNGDGKIKDEYRKLFADCMAFLKQPISKYRMSSLSRQLFCECVDTERIKNRRKTNHDILRHEIGSKFSDVLRYSYEQEAPLCLVIVTENRDLIQRELSHKGVYSQVLWPLTTEAKMECEFSEWFTAHMLAIPCDQRYNIEDMLAISNEVKEALTKSQD